MSAMPFVVQATAPGGNTTWISPPSVDGLRSLVDRHLAEILRDQSEACLAIAKMARAFKDDGIVFSVHSAQ
jgi:hypothetical protein